jgi:rhodanese-related sulfurtransferase
LTKVDLYRYDDRWEKEPAEALDLFFTQDDALASALVPITPKVKPQPQTSIIDLRQPLDFNDFHLPGSVNVPFVHEDTPSPFSEPDVLESLWKRLEETFKAPSAELLHLLQGRRVLLVCYNGDSARVATSVLRAEGHEADSLKGGFKALRKMREKSLSDGGFHVRNKADVESVAPQLGLNPVAI